MFPKLSVFHKRAEVLLTSAAVQDKVVKPAVIFLDLKDRGREGVDRIDPYIAGLFRNDPFVKSDIVFANDAVENAGAVGRAMPDRHVYVLQLDDGALREFPSPH
jgi:hypothetical protein